jgi:hypothetical protein
MTKCFTPHHLQFTSGSIYLPTTQESQQIIGFFNYNKKKTVRIYNTFSHPSQRSNGCHAYINNGWKCEGEAAFSGCAKFYKCLSTGSKVIRGDTHTSQYYTPILFLLTE